MSSATASSSSIERPSRKRPRLSSPEDAKKNNANESNTNNLPTSLPECVWAHVLDYLPYNSVLQCAAVSRFMLRDVMPFVSMLHIQHAREIHSGIAHRYRDVSDIYIYSLITTEDVDLEDVVGIVEERRVDEDTATRVVPFLCHFNNKLERVFLGGRNHNTGDAEGYVPSFHEEDDDKECMTALIDAFSGAFRSGSLPNHLLVLGLACPRASRMTHIFGESSCLVCRRACKSWPIQAVIDFECEASSEYQAWYRRRHPNDPSFVTEQLFCLDVCISRNMIEEILCERPGGRDVLHSDTRLFDLLGRGERMIVVSNHDRELYVVKYSPSELEAIKRWIETTNRDVAMLSSDAVTDAIKRSFAADERDPLPPRDQCYFAESSFVSLQSFGLPIDEADFLNDDEWGDGRKRSEIMHYNWRFT